MQPGTELLVDLASFRKRNGLLQQDVADFLEVSRGYVSMVEKGSSKLSRTNIEKIFAAAGRQQWDTQDLVPAYTRARKAVEYINREGNRGLSADNRQIHVLKPEIEERLKYGVIGITDGIADSLTGLYPALNRQWLVSGEGDMLLETAGTEGRRTDAEELKEMIGGLRDELASMIERMTERIIKEIRSN